MPKDSAGKTKAAVAVRLRRSSKQSDTVDFFTIFFNFFYVFLVLIIFDKKWSFPGWILSLPHL